ncbi:hypothetical protein BCR44DRAFT_1005962 [Catenaria anguillulae PL171]|uniref:Uncharacterized protein n=1 Tax=Catenaria anguillulae PL171 TaxID=765915 RepID=A0A1Y2I5T0_9FUNG|nr:hypothetical protein BCR44DRAFT_1005962 [Catenaria anguillulae PL171]
MYRMPRSGSAWQFSSWDPRPTRHDRTRERDGMGGALAWVVLGWRVRWKWCARPCFVGSTTECWRRRRVDAVDGDEEKAQEP